MDRPGLTALRLSTAFASPYPDPHVNNITVDVWVFFNDMSIIKIPPAFFHPTDYLTGAKTLAP